jgi:hypothetical protein
MARPHAYPFELHRGLRGHAEGIRVSMIHGQELVDP